MSQASVKKAGWALGPMAVVAVVVALWALTLGQAPASSAAQVREQAEAEPLSPAAYTRLKHLRDELALRPPDLAAMGLGREQAEALLRSMRAWIEQNGPALAQAEANERDRRRALEEAYRRFHVGPRDGQVVRSLPKLEVELNQARNQRASLASSLATQIDARLTAAQRRVWRAARRNRDLAAPLRYAADLSEAQRQALSQRGTRRRGLRGGLTASQRSGIEQARTNAAARMTGVLLAEEAILPLPPELVRERAALEPDPVHINGGGR